MCTHTYWAYYKTMHSTVANFSTSATMKLFAWHIFSVQLDICNKTNTFEYYEVERCQQPSETVRQWDSGPLIFLLLGLKLPIRLRLCAINPFENSLSSSKRVQLAKANRCWFCCFWTLKIQSVTIYGFFGESNETSPCRDFHHRGRCGSSNDSVI